MNRYVVGFCNLFDNHLVLSEIVTHSELDAMLQFLDISPEDYPDEESVHDYVANGDGYINVIKVD